MSMPSENGGIERLLSGRRHGKAADQKSNFAQTCNLLSQYLKEKRSLGDVNLSIPSIIEPKDKQKSKEQMTTTMNLLTKMENKAEFSKQTGQSMEFPTQSASTDNVTNKVDFRKEAAAAAAAAMAEKVEKGQMTIFYGGQVVVFNDFPSEKAKEIMALASKGVSSANVSDRTEQIVSDAAFADQTKLGNQIGNKLPAQEIIPQQPLAKASDLPITRRVSLKGFFAKRRDRVAARAPYQVNQQYQEVTFSTRSGESSWERVQRQEPHSTKQFDLNL